MGSPIPFDTLKFARRLKDAGLPENQAEAISDAIREIQDIQLDNLATRRDIRELETRIEAQGQSLEAKIEAQGQSLNARIDKRYDELDAKIDKRCDELDVKIETIKADLQISIKELDTRMEVRLRELDTKFSRDMKELELRMVIKLGTLTLVGIGLLFGLLRAWPLSVHAIPVQETRSAAAPAQPPR